ncbi:hypothetical protein PULV_b0335 [Pseudoalteromonas ulvae UL12]|nr:hypothetical protein [Pseudoalteromonas ulvae UL12]
MRTFIILIGLLLVVMPSLAKHICVKVLQLKCNNITLI